MVITFWLLVFTVVYTYIGYGVLLHGLVWLKRLFYKPALSDAGYEPTVSLLIAAYNEENFIKEKIINTLQLDYPAHKIEYVFVTDGSTDNTPTLIAKHPELRLLHQPERRGKIAAVERSISQLNGEIVVFTDANTFLNKEAIRNIIRKFANPRVGVVSGEKRILNSDADEAAGAGEGFYWKYESKLKKWDAELYSVMGAAGELFAIRKNLYEPIPKDSLIEDFYLSFKILEKGFIIAYEPEAYALEEPSASIGEELKRKIRIAAGGIQSIVRLSELLNPFRYGIVTFQYISHRVLRWTLAPLALPLVFILNIFLLNHGGIYPWLFVAQLLFYGAALAGYVMEKQHIRLKILFIPYYFCMMNYAVYLGFIRFIKGSQSVIWEKSARRNS